MSSLCTFDENLTITSLEEEGVEVSFNDENMAPNKLIRESFCTNNMNKNRMKMKMKIQEKNAII